MDPLSEILELVGVQSSIYFQKDFCGPWKMSVADTGFAQFHYVVRGTALLEHDGTEEFLSAGDIVVFPKGATHSIGDHPSTTALPGQNVISTIHTDAEPYVEGVFNTSMVCGHFEYDFTHPHPLIRHLPDRIILRTTDLPMCSLLLSLLPVIVRETSEGLMGNHIVIKHLSHALFTSILRTYYETLDTDIGPHAGLRDARILKALSAIHEPDGWSYGLSDLAALVGMSRSSFAATFKALIGQSPGEYAVCWKLLKAKQALEQTKNPAEQIAFDYGYSSASAFSRAFRKNFGINPSDVRAARKPLPA